MGQATNHEGGNHKAVFSALGRRAFMVRQVEFAVNMERGYGEVIHAFDTVGVGAWAAPERKTVLLTFETDKGLEFHFALPIDEVSRIRRDIHDAEKKCKEAKPPTRH